jgi:hypothetical protein
MAARMARILSDIIKRIADVVKDSNEMKSREHLQAMVEITNAAYESGTDDDDRGEEDGEMDLCQDGVCPRGGWPGQGGPGHGGNSGQSQQLQSTRIISGAAHCTGGHNIPNP